MKKSANVDISNLFRKFGGDTGSYKEIQQDYIGEKAQKNWPIVQAVEKERAVAPRLKMAHHVAPHPAPEPAVAGHVPHHRATESSGGNQTSTRSLFGGMGADSPLAGIAGKPASPLFGAVGKPATPLAGSAEQPVSSLFGAPERPAPASPLFGAVEKPSPASALFGAADKPAPASMLFGAAEKPVPASVAEKGSLFGTLRGAAQPAPVAVQSEPAQVRRSEGDALNAVFSRLLNPQPAPAAAAPENNLRSMLGFLTK